MLNTLLVATVLSASAATSPLTHLLHLNPHMTVVDPRVSIVLENKSLHFVDVKIAGQEYTILGNRNLSVKAPVGTAIYSESITYNLHPGDVIATLAPAMNNTRLTVR